MENDSDRKGNNCRVENDSDRGRINLVKNCRPIKFFSLMNTKTSKVKKLKLSMDR